MTAFSESFRAEVARIARKEVKEDVASLRKAVNTFRSDIAALKREKKALETQVRSLVKVIEKSLSQAPVNLTEARKPNENAFNHEVLIAKRKALGFTKKQMAALIGVSPLSVYKWETGKVAPRAAQLERLQSVLKMGVREARANASQVGVI